MTRIDDIYDLKNVQSLELPSNVVVIAQGKTVRGLKGLSDALTLHECDLDQVPSETVLADAKIIVAEVDPNHDGSINRLDEIAAKCPHAPLIAGVDSLNIRTTRALLKRGVTDLLEIPFSIEELLDALADIDLSKIDASEEVVLAPTVAFIGCAGGVGTTTIATHVAAVMGDAFGETTLLDLDIQEGDVCDYLGMPARQTLQDIFEAGKRLDPELLKSSMTVRDAMPEVLAAPHDILPFEEIQFKRLLPIMSMLRSSRDLLAIDMPSVIANWGLSTLCSSQQIVLVGSLSVHKLRKMRRLIDFMISMGIERDAINVVANHVNTGLFQTIKKEEAEEALRHPIIGLIPADTNHLRQAQDQGELVWTVHHRTKFEKAIRALADELIQKLEAES